MSPEQIEALESYKEWVENATLEGREDVSIGAFIEERERGAAIETIRYIHDIIAVGVRSEGVSYPDAIERILAMVEPFKPYFAATAVAL